jgi:uncharacterized RDD family membrane protein YckC
MSSQYGDAEERLGRGSHELRRDIVTPDGVPIRIEIAGLGERYAAFAADLTLTFAPSLAIEVFGGLTGAGGLAISAFVYFLVRNCYFIFFELQWSGRTPGKKWMGLRVIDHHGGPLSPGSIVARNLIREVEIFFPLGLVVAGRAWARAPWEMAVVVLWIILMAALPAANRGRQRAGDLLGGTIVIRAPKRALLEELAAEERDYVFSTAQLQYYGIAELHVLEDVLRMPHTDDLPRLEAES